MYHASEIQLKFVCLPANLVSVRLLKFLTCISVETEKHTDQVKPSSNTPYI